MATTYSQLSHTHKYPVIPGVDNSILPRNIIEAYARPRGPYTLDNSSRLLDEHATLELLNGWLVWKEMGDLNERRIAGNIEKVLGLIVGEIADPWIEEGQRRTLINTIRSILGARFGNENLPNDLTKRLEQLTFEQLNNLPISAATEPSLTDWLGAL
jgi:hypothetical protein